jgi:hypothetical protein
MALEIRLPQPPYPTVKMRRAVGMSFQVCSHPILCRDCGVLEAIGRTPAEAERRAIDLYAEHCKTFHAHVMHEHAEKH